MFLSVDDDVLATVGRGLGNDCHPDATRDFIHAVQRKMVRGGYRVNLAAVHGRTDRGLPAGLGFLCAMVLAASRMAEQGEVSQINYFRRLREVLDLPLEGHRPPGMEGGGEEVLWDEWNRYLRELEFVPTARRGSDDPHKYINYPISQALLRRADKDRLYRLFAEKGWTADWDVETLLTRIRLEAGRLTQHLRNDLLSGGGPRLLALADAVYEIYAAWKDNPNRNLPRPEALTGGSTVLGGLIRFEDPIFGDVSYHLYPRRPLRRRIDDVRVSYGGESRSVRAERPGWFEPVGPVSENELRAGARWTIEVPEELSHLVLPKREFWILTPDPDHPESGVFASWGRPPLGTPFVVLCRAHLLSQFDHLRRERLIEFADDPEPVLSGRDWHEIRHCMVVSPAWSGVFVEHRDLLDALRPIVSLTIGVAGGLRAPGAHGWIEGHGPTVTVFGFEPTIRVTVIDERDGSIIFATTCGPNTPLAIPWSDPGEYRIEVGAGETSSERSVKIWSWNELSAADPVERQYVLLGENRLCGAALEQAGGGGP
ncbi:MAG: hypothetical protein M3Q03_10365 [Chloroflexota bacterium]|nr:hypothetical protein [Chloroflexota bacterium]